MGTEHLVFHITEKRGERVEELMGEGSGGLCSRALFSVQLLVDVLCSCLGLWIRCLWKMFFSVVVLVLTKALVAGKFTLITVIETSTKVHN